VIHLHANSVWILISIGCFAAGSVWGIVLVQILRRFTDELDCSSSSRGGEQELHLEEPASFDLGSAGSSPSELSLESI
jgi:hypothetical protein